MKFRIARFLLILLSLSVLWGCIGEDTPSPDETTLVGVGETAPDFTVELFDGGSLRLSDLRGKVVLLTFFASWCPECREELAAIRDSALDRFADTDFHLLCISRGETREALADFRAESGFTFPMGLDPDGSIYGLYATLTVPLNFLLDASGRVVSLTVGYDPSEFAALLDHAAALLAD